MGIVAISIIATYGPRRLQLCPNSFSSVMAFLMECSYDLGQISIIKDVKKPRQLHHDIEQTGFGAEVIHICTGK